MQPVSVSQKSLPMQAWKCASFESPYYDAGHRETAQLLDAFIQEELGSVVSSLRMPPAQRLRTYIQILARKGWLKYLDAISQQPGEALAPRLDLRRIGLIRQGLAHLDDLVDCAFSIQGLGLAPIALYGNEDLRRRYVEPSLTGEIMGAFAVTEATGGSNPGHMSLTARREEEHFVLDGEKCWISQVGVADFYCVFAATNPALGPLGISCIVVPARTPGLTEVPSTEFLAERPVGTLRFQNCRVPVSNLVGRAGFGFRYAMEVIEMYRINLASAAIGASAKAMEMALQQARSRQLGEHHLRDFQMTQDKIADMSIRISAASLLAAHAAWVYDTKSRGLTKFAASAKYYATESAQVIIDQALQLFGAEGLVSGHRIEALYRQIRSSRIYEGTSEIQKLIIAKAELQG